jgi:hypothetical protein
VLTDAEVEEIRQGLASGMRGPVLIGWCEKLLADRDEKVARRQPVAMEGLTEEAQFARDNFDRTANSPMTWGLTAHKLLLAAMP